MNPETLIFEAVATRVFGQPEGILVEVDGAGPTAWAPLTRDEAIKLARAILEQVGE